jgi:hypothetical protein
MVTTRIGYAAAFFPFTNVLSPALEPSDHFHVIVRFAAASTGELSARVKSSDVVIMSDIDLRSMYEECNCDVTRVEISSVVGERRSESRRTPVPLGLVAFW